jgi:hypothetical protein
MLHELVVSTNTAFWKAAEDEEKEYTKKTVTSLLSLNLSSYTVPEEAEITMLEKHLPGGCEPLPKRLRFYFSAAAHAVTFLTKSHTNVRACLRRIILNEAHASFGSLHNYAPGLISFCKGNPKLRIEWHVDSWRTVLTAQKEWLRVWKLVIKGAHGELEPYMLANMGTYYRFWVSPSFVPWIKETSALSAAGMPPGCFSLVFYSDSVATTQSIVNILGEDAAWQEAPERTYTAETNPLRTWEEIIYRTKGICYFSETFPRVIRALSQEQTLIRFEGVAGMSTDIDTYSEALQGYKLEEFCTHWRIMSYQVIPPPPPLPSWLDILYKYVQDVEATTGAA